MARPILVVPKRPTELATQTTEVLMNTFIFRAICECLEDPDVDGRIILRRIFSKWDVGGTWTALIWLRIGTGGERL